MQLEVVLYEKTVNQRVTHNFFTSLTDPVDLTLLINNVALRYSELITSECLVFNVRTFWDKMPSEETDGDTINLLGAILPTTTLAHYNKSGSLYYWVSKGGNLVSRRLLVVFGYYDMFDNGVLLPAWQSYFEGKLTDFYDNTDYELKDENYNVLKFHHLNPKIHHRKAFRYPHRFMKWYQ